MQFETYMIIIRLLAENCNNKFKKGLAVSKPLPIFAMSYNINGGG